MSAFTRPGRSTPAVPAAVGQRRLHPALAHGWLLLLAAVLTAAVVLGTTTVVSRWA